MTCLQNNRHPLSLQENIGDIVRNDNYYDTLLLCNDGSLVHNKLVIGLAFPYLAKSDIFSLPLQTTLILPDHCVKEIQELVTRLFSYEESSVPFNSLDQFTDNFDLSRLECTLTSEPGDKLLSEKVFRCCFCPSDFEKFDLLVRHKKKHWEDKKRPKTEVGSLATPQIQCNVSAALTNDLRENHDTKQQLEIDNDLCFENLDAHGTNWKNTKETKDALEQFQTKMLCEDVPDFDADLNGVSDDFDRKMQPELLEKGKQIQKYKNQNDEKPYSCSFCGKGFPSQGPMLIHERTHTKEYPYSCNYCHRKFNQSWHVKVHERIHTGERPFQCSDCGKCFASNSTLTSHKVLHQQDRPYKCKFCDKGFNHMSGLRSHENLHTGEEQYMCEDCGKTFLSKKNLNRHHCKKDELKTQATENSVEKFMCLECGRQYKTKKILKRHKCIRTFELPSQSAGIRTNLGIQLT